MSINLKNCGYFTSGDQTEPAYDPGLDVNCPVCHKHLNYPAQMCKTVSVMWQGDNRCYFYRVHKDCYEALDEHGQGEIDGIILDAIAASQNVN